MEELLDTPAAGRNDDVPDGTLVRMVADLTPGEGRTVDVKIVPYGERIMHDDGLGGLPKGMPYQEEWVPGAFAHQVRGAEAGRAKNVTVNIEHEQGVRGIVGHGVMLREEADGFYGSFVLHPGPDGDKALYLVKEGIFSGVSLEARSLRAMRGAGGIVRRMKGQLKAIALCREPAYKTAQVLALREEAELGEEEENIFLAEEFQPIYMKDDVVARCRRIGTELPQRYTAHPAETGTPAQAGTPEDGTRPTP